MAIEVDPNWWKHLFDEVYLLTDARSVCDREVTRREVDFFLEVVPAEKEHNIVDLCGGHGRHSLELCERGFTGCTVVDYSGRLIKRGAREAEKRGRRVRFLRADARDTSLESGFADHVFVLGNSLGYQTELEADADICREAFRLLRPGGWLVLDVADGSAVRDRFIPDSWHEIGDDLVVCRKRELGRGRIKAREMVMSKTNGIIRDATYAIRTYDADGLRALARSAGFEDAVTLGGKSFHHKAGDYGFMNNRLILTAQKPK